MLGVGGREQPVQGRADTPSWFLNPLDHSVGYVFADIALSNPRRTDLEPVPARALADTGALNLCIPQHVANQLQLETDSSREVSMADGTMINVPYVGPIRVAFGKRSCFVGALVFGDEVLFGAVPMEDMDLIVDPLRERITVDPASPNIPHARAKQLTPRRWGPNDLSQRTDDS